MEPTTQSLFLLLIVLERKGLIDAGDIKTVLSAGLIPPEMFMKLLGEKKDVASADADTGL